MDHTIKSAHDCTVGSYKPTKNDTLSLRYPGFGCTMNILYGERTCGQGDIDDMNTINASNVHICLSCRFGKLCRIGVPISHAAPNRIACNAHTVRYGRNRAPNRMDCHHPKCTNALMFGTVVEMLDISNLNIEIKTSAELLSANVVYGVYLVFKFCESRNFASKPMHVDLNYRKGHEILNAYFATWRDNEWMTVELYRFLNQQEDVVFEFLLDCFSSYDCGDGAVYIEGIEFRAIQKVKHEEIGKLKEVLKSNFEADQVQQLPCNFEEIYKISRNYDELFWLGEVNGKKLLIVLAKEALYKSSNVNFLTSTPSAQSRFQELIELLPQKVFYINCTIKRQMLSPDTEYVCYLVFKLSEECQGLHNPVKVRDLLHQDNNEAEFFYFNTPSLLNIHDFTRVPKQREDGWMEIQLWKFNSAHEFKDDSLSVNMKFTSLEGTMSGLIVGGLEFRTM